MGNKFSNHWADEPVDSERVAIYAYVVTFIMIAIMLAL